MTLDHKEVLAFSCRIKWITKKGEENVLTLKTWGNSVMQFLPI